MFRGSPAKCVTLKTINDKVKASIIPVFLAANLWLCDPLSWVSGLLSDPEFKVPLLCQRRLRIRVKGFSTLLEIFFSTLLENFFLKCTGDFRPQSVFNALEIFSTALEIRSLLCHWRLGHSVQACHFLEDVIVTREELPGWFFSGEKLN